MKGNTHPLKLVIVRDMWPASRRAAGIGLFVLKMAVTPAHADMLQRPELSGVPYWALILRLPIQVALLALIAWSTWAGADRPSRDSAV